MSNPLQLLMKLNYYTYTLFVLYYVKFRQSRAFNVIIVMNIAIKLLGIKIYYYA